jgi:hypothetical protein
MSRPQPRLSPEPERVEGARWVPLTKGLFALVDEQDFSVVSDFTWSASLPSKRSTPYAAAWSKGVTSKTRKIYMHRFLLGFPVGGVDHVNGNSLDNRRANLRRCNQSQNSANRRKGTATSSKFKGVCRHRNKWKAQIGGAQGVRTKYLGVFEDEEDAARAYDEVATAVFGEFAKINFPRGVSSDV